MNLALRSLRPLAFVAACIFTMTAGGDCMSYNPQTVLDGAHGPDDLGSPLVDIDHLDAPGLVLVAGVGDTFRIQVNAEGANGSPLKDTEARIHTYFDAAILELVIACGGQDVNPHLFSPNQPTPPSARIADCQGLVPAYHAFENDGVMWFKFRALMEGETTVRFAYPGELITGTTTISGEPSPAPFSNLTPQPVPGGYTDEVFTQVAIGGAPADSDDDGVPDFEDECPGTPESSDVDDDGCPIEPVDSDGDGVVDGDDLCDGTPDDTPVDEDGCPLPDEPEDSDGDGVVDEDDDCPGTPDDTPVDEHGCPLPDADHPTIDQIAPSSYIFRGTETSNECGFTEVTNEVAAASSNEGGIMPLKIQTFFPSMGPGPAPTSTVQGPYDPNTGQYLANGTTAVGGQHDLDGVWTLDMLGRPRFDGVLIERFLSPTCENSWDVSYSID